MSDIESDKEDYNSDNSDDEEFTSTTTKKQLVNQQKKSANNYGADIESDEEDEELIEDEDENDEEDDDDNNSGIIDGEAEAKGPGDEDEDYYDDDEDGSEDGDDDDNEPSQKKKPSSKVKQPMTNTASYDYDEDDDDDDDENYLQKFDNDINKNYILDNHPECLQHNYDEITCLSRIVRDKDNIIIDPLHKTIPILTKYERARILGQRAKQIESGAKPLVKVPDNIIDGYLIAELELREKKIPFVIKRPLPDGSCEYWNVKDLEVIIY